MPDAVATPAAPAPASPVAAPKPSASSQTSPGVPAAKTPASKASQHADAPKPGRAVENLADFGKRLEELVGGDEPSKETTKAEGKPEGDDVQKTAEQLVKTDEPPKPAESKPPVKASDLRKAYDASKAKVNELLKQNQELQAKLADPAKETEALKLANEKLAAAEKRLQDYETDIQFKDYEKSEDYRKQYWQPYEDAYRAGQEWVRQLTVENEDQPRRATAEDFERIMVQFVQDPGAAMKAMREMFGDAQYPSVLDEVKTIARLNNARVKALEKFKTEGAHKLTERKTQAQLHQKQQSDLFQKEREAGIASKPGWFKPLEGDPEHAALLEKGKNEANYLFNIEKLKNDQGEFEELSVEDKLKFHAAAANKLAAFDAVVYRMEKLRAALKEARQRLKEFEASEPQGGRTRRPSNGNEFPSGGSTIDGVFAEIDKRARPLR